ncbi:MULTISPECIES: S1 family peptidase [unclassified Crossiella]|uniref:S1 family peptidase n=1 Tax=unclassified Crossiella TaxID=2620835 RepID=UPI001FFF5195|nr:MULTISPECIES: S1 family peptidase [unclassified Crossiella]MCK2242935.1 S1 family peptidase [Crossiella sp. S99.2]MCK2256812.1 S1 family peptidase [Crossiella sp. S99.1]
MRGTRQLGTGHHLRRGLGAVLGAALLLSAFGGAAQAGAQDRWKTDVPPGTELPDEPPPGGFGSWRELIEVQERLSAGAQRFSDAVEGATDSGGYAGIAISPEHRTLQVYWQGPVPPRPDSVLAELRRDYRVEVADVRHSRAELFANRDRIATERGVTGVVPAVDGSGVTVRFSGTEEEARKLPTVLAATVPVTIEAGSRVDALACTGRQDDCSPYWGGSVYRTGGGCSTGFPVRHHTAAGVSAKMLSAGHCGANGNAVRDGANEGWGVVEHDRNSWDTLLIRPVAPQSVQLKRIYVGPWNAGIPSNRVVAAATKSFVGQFVCTSGAFSGQHCNVKVTAVNVPLPSLGFLDTVEAKQIHKTCAARPGDSGGPVYLPLANGQVNAKGTISAGYLGGAVCPGQAVGAGAWHIFYVDITDTFARYNADPAFPGTLTL